MNFGYLIFVAEHKEIDYLKLAYALALTIKNTQKAGYDKVALVVNDKDQLSRLTSPWVFDIVIEWDQESFWDGRSWMDKLTPWDHTVCLDADMLFTRDYSHWIDFFIKNCDLYIPHKSYTYRGETVSNDFYRKAFVKNDLPNLYSFYTFFKKGSSVTAEFFKLGRYIIKYPTEFKNLYLSKYKPEVVGTDEAFALSSKLLDLSSSISFELNFPKVVHMKSAAQNWSYVTDTWTENVGFYVDRKGQIKIGNYQQVDILHYVDKQIITDEIIDILEGIAWKK